MWGSRVIDYASRSKRPWGLARSQRTAQGTVSGLASQGRILTGVEDASCARSDYSQSHRGKTVGVHVKNQMSYILLQDSREQVVADFKIFEDEDLKEKKR